MPPTTATPSGARASPPAPKPSAMGRMPAMVESAVIITGRKRVREAIVPYELFVRTESEQLRARQEELARLGAGLDTLRGRIEALG